jgi:glutamate carboxypeptidase
MTHLPSLDAADRIDVQALHSWLDEHRQHLVDDLVALAELETPSNDPELLSRGLKHLEEWVTDRLGAPAERTQHRSEDHGDVLILDYPGDGPQPLLALGHYDTVFDAGTLQHWPVQVDGDRLCGPGVFDMKGGLVQLVWALRALSQLAMPRPPVRLLLNGDEEIGSPFSRPILEAAGTDTAAVLVFEASADGAVKTARKGVGLFDIAAHGVESHAGLDPLAGASAVGEIARVITTLHDAADLRRGTSINVGTVRGGTRANVVAGTASVSIDVRVAADEERRRVDELLASLAPHDNRVTLEVTGDWNRPVMTRTDDIAHMYQLARATGRRMGVELRETSVGGASDGNFLAAHGLPVLDGLGAVGGGAHARHEHVSITGMVERSALAAGLIATFTPDI